MFCGAPCSPTPMRTFTNMCPLPFPGNGEWSATDTQTSRLCALSSRGWLNCREQAEGNGKAQQYLRNLAKGFAERGSLSPYRRSHCGKFSAADVIASRGAHLAALRNRGVAERARHRLL